jgi:hypothetical protein
MKHEHLSFPLSHDLVQMVVVCFSHINYFQIGLSVNPPFVLNNSTSEKEMGNLSSAE